MENELKRLKCELHSCSQTEKELRNQLNTALGDYSTVSHDLTRLKQEHEDTKSKYHYLFLPKTVLTILIFNIFLEFSVC